MPSTEHFWLPLGLSLLIVLTAAAYLVQRDILHYIKYSRLIILSKLASSVSYLVTYFIFEHSFAYFAAFMTDFSRCTPDFLGTLATGSDDGIEVGLQNKIGPCCLGLLAKFFVLLFFAFFFFANNQHRTTLRAYVTFGTRS